MENQDLDNNQVKSKNLEIKDGQFTFQGKVFNDPHQVKEWKEAEEDEEKDLIDELVEQKKSAAALILELVQSQQTTFFHDQLNEAYLYFGNDGSSIMKLDSSEFQEWLFNFTFEKNQKVTNRTTLDAAVKIMKHRAKENLIELNVRTAKGENSAIYYDLGGKNFVEIRKNGWTILDGKYSTYLPPIFKRFKHQKPQVHPELGGNINDFIDLINLKDEKEKLLLKVYLVAAFIPNFPHPVLVVHGPQGSAKSTACILIKNLADPSFLGSTSINDDKDVKEIIQVASHHWLLVLDNLSHLSDTISDTISRICTGGGLSKRRHYSNDDDFIYNFRHLVVINGIRQVISKPDLLDRSILLELERIPEEKRMTEEELWTRFDSIKPKVLGAIFDAVSRALNEYLNINQTSLPRMADFGKWGCAIAKALGHKEEDFINVYASNTNKQNQEAISASSMATVIVKFMTDRDVYEGTPSELLKLLEEIADDLKVKEAYDFPKGSNWVWKRIVDVIPNLAAVGIKVEQGKEKERKIKLQKTKIQDSTDDTVNELANELVQQNIEKDSTDSIDSIPNF